MLWPRFTALAILISAMGCSDPVGTAHREKVVPVSGTLTYQGQPLEFFQITFRPTDGRRPASGVTDAAGKFTLGTNDQNDGAPPGTHKLAIAFIGPPLADNADQVPTEDGASLRPQSKVKIPAHYGDPETSGLTQEVPAGGLTDLKLDLQ